MNKYKIITLFPPVFLIVAVRAYPQPILYLIVCKENYAHALRYKFDLGTAYVPKDAS